MLVNVDIKNVYIDIIRYTYGGLIYYLSFCAPSTRKSACPRCEAGAMTAAWRSRENPVRGSDGALSVALSCPP